jgi:hypothetical protein
VSGCSRVILKEVKEEEEMKEKFRKRITPQVQPLYLRLVEVLHD